MDSLPKKIQYAPRDADGDYMGYYWDALRKSVKQICDDKKTSDMHRLILAWHTNMAPRRISDFIKMCINALDHGATNLLVFKPKWKH